MNFTPDHTPFDAIGGETPIRQLVDRFYDIMEMDESVRLIRDMHPENMEGARNKLFWFLCGWMGGPQYYMEKFGHPQLRARHLPFSIGDEERDQWMKCMTQAINDLVDDAAMRDYLIHSFQQTANHMRNRMEGVDATSIKAGIWKPQQ